MARRYLACSLANTSLVHILEYENYSGYDKTTQMIRDSPHAAAYRAMLPFLTSRTSQLTQEFAFLPTAPPRKEGGIFELRSYQLQAGALLEWEHAWLVSLISGSIHS